MIFTMIFIVAITDKIYSMMIEIVIIFIQTFIVHVQYRKHYWHLITLCTTVVNFDLGHTKV